MNKNNNQQKRSNILDQLNQLWDQNERLRVLGRFIVVFIFIIFSMMVVLVIIPSTLNFISGITPPLPTVTQTPTPTLTSTPGATTEPLPSPTPTATPVGETEKPEPHGLVQVLVDVILALWHDYSRTFLVLLFAFVIITIGSGRFVQDIFALENFRQGLRYVVTSITGLSYERLFVDHGDVDIESEEYNYLNVIGGPGILVVQPGNAALLRRLRAPSRTERNTDVFLRRFERIGDVVNLDEQANTVTEFNAVSKDGIQVTIRNISYRYQVRVEGDNIRNMDDAYPFQEDAVHAMAYNRLVNAYGLVPWRVSVQMAITTQIRNFISGHTIDYLTAPRQHGQEPRHEMRDFVQNNTRFPLFNLGTQLIWIDVGHIDIIRPDVDDERIDYWATDWAGTADAERALGQARVDAYQIIARAEAQAELITEIIDKLPPDGINLERLILERSARILDHISEANEEDGDDE